MVTWIDRACIGQQLFLPSLETCEFNSFLIVICSSFSIWGCCDVLLDPPLPVCDVLSYSPTPSMSLKLCEQVQNVQCKQIPFQWEKHVNMHICLILSQLIFFCFQKDDFVQYSLYTVCCLMRTCLYGKEGSGWLA